MLWFALLLALGVAFWATIGFLFGAVALILTLLVSLFLLGAVMVLAEEAAEEAEEEAEEFPPLRREMPRERRRAA